MGIDWLRVSLENKRKKGINMPEADAPAAFANIVTKNIKMMPANSNSKLIRIFPYEINPLSI